MKPQPKTRNPYAASAWNRKAGAHDDQKRRRDSKRLRRDKSYKEDR